MTPLLPSRAPVSSLERLEKEAIAGSQVFWPYLVSVSPSVMDLEGLHLWPVGKAGLLAQTACWFGHQPLLPPHYDPLTRATTIDQPDYRNPCLRLWLLGGWTSQEVFPGPAPIPILFTLSIQGPGSSLVTHGWTSLSWRWRSRFLESAPKWGTVRVNCCLAYLFLPVCLG